MKTVALITCTVLPEPDPDQELQLEALRALGLDARMLAWDDPTANPGACDLCVLRSCWDYYHDPDAFLAFIARAARESRLINGEAVIRWNIHKSYLTSLAKANVPVIPTVLFERGREIDVASVTEEQGWEDVVIKPAISAASYRTRRFNRGSLDEAQKFMASLLADGDAMIQRYIETFATSGERALVWIDGVFTHKVVKTPRFHGQDEAVSGAMPVTADEVDLGSRALACVDEPLVYARVDVVDVDGAPVISEFELMEPSLFFAQQPSALSRFAAAITRIVQK
jgi:glutathione synthase/RimK-type ligase-like ATP-grasp enzyme